MSKNKRNKIDKEKALEIKRIRAFLISVQKKKICLKSLQKSKLKNKELAQEYNVLEGIIYDVRVTLACLIPIVNS